MLVVLIVAVVAVGLGAVVYRSVAANDPYQAFLGACRREAGSSVVTVRTSTRMVAMGAPQRQYTLGCRRPDGTIGATITTDRSPSPPVTP